MKSIRLGVCLKAEDNPFWAVDVRRGIEQAAKGAAYVRIDYRSPSSIDQIGRQIEIVDELIASGVQGIIVAPSDPIACVAAVVRANAAQIPIVVIDTCLDPKEVSRLKPNFHFVGFDDYDGGFKTGELLKTKLGRGEKVAVFDGYRSGSYSDRVSGFRDAVADTLSISRIIGANFDEERAYFETLRLLQQDQSIRAIFAISDNMALGVLSAAEEAGRSDLLVCGFDATYVGRLAVEQGKLFSTVDSSPEEMGSEAVHLARRAVYGVATAERISIPISLVCRDESLSPPKRLIQRRSYTLLDALPDFSECNYANLAASLECPIVFGDSLERDLPMRLAALEADKYVIIADDVVANLYGFSLEAALQAARLNAQLLSFPTGEQHKTFTALNELAERALQGGITKRSCLIVLGGGVVGNLAGFLASTLLRGIRFVHVPTTTISQLDSTTGGKQAVNTRHGKNMLGTYYEPEFIYMNANLTSTLPAAHFRSGIAEAIKHGLCQSGELLKVIEERDYPRLLKETVRLKVHLIETDPLEKKEGVTLLYGHTIGHALETVTEHRLNHGEAISIGMVAAAMISSQLGLCDHSFVELHRSILKSHELPTRIPSGVSIERVLETLSFDKKERGGEIPFVLLAGPQRLASRRGSSLIAVPSLIILDVLRLLAQPLAGYLAA